MSLFFSSFLSLSLGQCEREVRWKHTCKSGPEGETKGSKVRSDEQHGDESWKRRRKVLLKISDSPATLFFWAGFSVNIKRIVAEEGLVRF